MNKLQHGLFLIGVSSTSNVCWVKASFSSSGLSGMAKKCEGSCLSCLSLLQEIHAQIISRNRFCASLTRERFPLPDAESFATCLRVESFCGKRLGRATLSDFTSALMHKCSVVKQIVGSSTSMLWSYFLRLNLLWFQVFLRFTFHVWHHRTMTGCLRQM